MTRLSHRQPTALHELVQAQAVRTPDSIAAICEERHLSYQELVTGFCFWAHHLHCLGLRVGDPVGIHMAHSLELPVIVLAVLAAGGVCVPLEPSSPAGRLGVVLGQVAPALVMTQRHLRSRLPDTTARVVVVDEEQPARGPALSVAVSGVSSAFVLLTSGSTGTPKGVVLSHVAVAARAYRPDDLLPPRGGCLAIMKTGISHSPFLGELFAPLLHGCYFVVARPGALQDVAYLGRLIQDHDVTTIAMSTSVLNAFLDWPGASRCRTLRTVLIGGESVSDELRRRFLERLEDAQLIVTYGATESGQATAYACSPKECLDDRIGRPIPMASGRVLDDRLDPVQTGELGEMYLGGPRLACGYLNQPGATAQRFVPDPDPTRPGERLFRSGDRARLTASGDLQFRGRLDRQIKLRGQRIEPDEIEVALGRHPSIGAAAVAVRGESASDRRLVAYIVPAGSTIPPTSSIDEFLRATLPAHMVPAEFQFLAALPLSSNGKIDRQALTDLDPEPGVPLSLRDGRLALPARSDAESDAAEGRQAVTALWRELLRVTHIPADARFLELGGNSLLAIMLANRIEQRFGVRPRIDEILTLTFEELASLSTSDA